MFDEVSNSLQTALKDWGMMQKTSGDEGADWAERFERNFYMFVSHFREWFNQQNPRANTIEEAETLKEVQDIKQQLPGPLQLNFQIELEEIVEEIETKRFD
ncbi:hypothetical protein [Litchfieldia alkalitelluris]|uniref:hypothetical protein n=1 Tax=Litchfieldia alkalitelluris TaxID=304268 RepID=UPI000998B64D|nr:hypothetical protein [Litchfieldia alkalitelluris]